MHASIGRLISDRAEFSTILPAYVHQALFRHLCVSIGSRPSLLRTLPLSFRVSQWIGDCSHCIVNLMELGQQIVAVMRQSSKTCGANGSFKYRKRKKLLTNSRHTFYMHSLSLPDSGRPGEKLFAS
jgi:hypothetical protein